MPIDGEAVRILRTRTGIAPGAFATRIGISESYLRDIEAGKRNLKRNRELIFLIARELDVPIRMVTRSIGDTPCF